MVSKIEQYHKDFTKHANKSRALGVARFFKTGKGEYGEGDQFLGLTVPMVRTLAKNYYAMDMNEIAAVLASPWHEERLGALIILVHAMKKATQSKQRKEIFNFYMKHISGINNWDLVDVSAEHCVGKYLADLDLAQQQKVLKKMIQSKNIWERRIAVIATFHFSRNRISDIVLWVVPQLLSDTHDLIHKACGWMLREFGKRSSEPALIKFLKQYYRAMPRTMLRYALEKLEPETKAFFMRK